MIALYPSTIDKNFSIVSPESIMESIVTGKWENEICYLRTLNKSEYDAEKKGLPAIVWGGLFKPGTRQINTLTEYSNLVVIDVDKLEFSAITLLKQQFLHDEFIRYCFVSPSNKGLKIVIKVNSGGENHRAAFLHLKNYLETKYLIKVDNSGKDVCRLCYVSWDPVSIINGNSKTFEVDLKYAEIISEHVSTESHKAANVFKVCIKWVERNKVYQDGEKNVFIHALACAMNRCGVNREDTINLINENYVTPDQKWHQSVFSAYFHNQHEHGSVQVRDIGTSEFVAPAYIDTYNTDVALNDLMQTTAMLWNYKVPMGNIKDIVTKISKLYHGQGYVNMNGVNLNMMMNQSILQLQQNTVIQMEKMALPYSVAEDMANELLNHGTDENAITTGLPVFDSEMFGGMQMGNVYGLIGMPESFKSVLAEYMCFVNAINGVPSLYLNSEMSRHQLYERLVYLAFGIDLRDAIKNKHLTKETVADFIKQLTEITKNNIFVVNDSGHTKQTVLATIDHIFNTTGKKIKIVVSDGISHWKWANENEISSAINTSFQAKELAKEAHNGEGIAHLALIHISGDIKRWFRDTGNYVRGGKKMLANLDAYFCLSRLIDPATNMLVNEDDVQFLPGKFYLRYIDKRSKTGTVNAIVNVTGNLKLEVEGTDPARYELRIDKKQKQY